MPDHGQVHAKVFISCGQMAGSAEVNIAHEIAQGLAALGYEPYVAVEQQSLRALRDNIFIALEESEYFLFVDFKREKLDTPEGAAHRGSLFCHQELAIASYLDLPVLAFREEGTEQRNGVAGVLQMNSVPFVERRHLAKVVAEAVRTAQEWDPNWKSQLDMTGSPVEWHDMRAREANRLARFYGVPVKNRHRRKAAMNCYVYIERLVKKPSGEDITPRKIELHWGGYIHPNALIGPGASRPFDAFFVYPEEPSELTVMAHTASGLYQPRVHGPGDFEITYAVVSENFPTARGTFDLHVGNSVEELMLEARQDHA